MIGVVLQIVGFGHYQIEEVYGCASAEDLGDDGFVYVGGYLVYLCLVSLVHDLLLYVGFQDEVGDHYDN